MDKLAGAVFLENIDKYMAEISTNKRIMKSIRHGYA